MVHIIQFFQLIWIIPRAHPLIWTPKQTSGCFGTGSADFDFLKPECQPGEIIAVKDFYAGSKSTYLRCPRESTDLNRNHSKCCTYAKDDCQFHLDGQGKGLWFYTNCTGRTDCTLRVDRVTAGRPCDFLSHLTPTNYMFMNYYCIPESVHQSISYQRVFNGSTLYLYNNKYPETVHVDFNHTCRVSAPCGSEITITALDIRFQYNTDGSCAQYLLVEEADSTQAIDCTFNNNFVIKSIFTSKGNILKLTLNNSLSVPGGYFWIQLNSSDPGVEIEVTCGISAVFQPQPEHLCPHPTPSPDYMSRSPIPSASAHVPHKTPSEDSGMHPATIAVIAVVGLCFIGIIFLVVLYCVKKKKLMTAQQRGCTTEVSQNQNQPSLFRAVLCFCTDRNTTSTWASRTRDAPPATSGEGQHDTSETAGPPSSAMFVPQRRSELPPLPQITRIPPVDMSDNKITPRLDPLLLGQIPPNATTSNSAAPPKLPPIIPRASW